MGYVYISGLVIIGAFFLIGGILCLVTIGTGGKASSQYDISQERDYMRYIEHQRRKAERGR